MTENGDRRMTSIRAAITDLHTAVDQLTKPQRRGISRGDKWEYHTVTSLWDQLLDADRTRSENTTRKGPGSSPPSDLEVLELRYTIRETIADALTGHGQKPRDTVPSSLRLLATTIGSTGDTDLIALWTHLIGSWGRQITTVLRLTDDPRSRRLRGTRCPACSARHVTIDIGGGETEIAPPLMIEFAEGRIRAVTCSACSVTWWRGDQLLQLADLIVQSERIPA